MPIEFEKIREQSLPKHKFSGKIRATEGGSAASAAAMIHGGVYPDLLGDAARSQRPTISACARSLPSYIFIQAADAGTGPSVEEIAVSIAERRMVRLVPATG